MASTAMQLASRITLGWNAGNTLEAIGGETAWGNPQITREQISFVKASGFDSIRLPCSWNQYANQTTAKIDDAWLNRVRQVVQYCIDADMTVLLNIHWDGGWLDENINASARDATAAKQKAFWEQIATHLRDFDERLMFASANEPPADDAAEMDILFHYHQTFIDAVRSTGGRNAYRVLVLQGPSTDIEKSDLLWNRMPTDTLDHRLMAEVHYYTPPNFAILSEDASWGRMFYYWGRDYHSTTDPTRNADWGEEDTVDQMMALMKRKFVDSGIPVVLGEYGAVRRTNLTGDDLTLHLASRAYYFKYVTQQARANGLLPYHWDTGDLINRRSLTVVDQQALDALLDGAGKK